MNALIEYPRKKKTAGAKRGGGKNERSTGVKYHPVESAGRHNGTKDGEGYQRS